MDNIELSLFNWAKSEIKKAYEADESVWTKLRRIEEYVKINQEDHKILVDYCHELLEV